MASRAKSEKEGCLTQPLKCYFLHASQVAFFLALKFIIRV